MKTTHLLCIWSFIFTLQYCSIPCQSLSITQTFLSQHSWENITEIFTTFDTRGFLNDNEVTNYLKDLRNNFPAIVLKLETIGKTNEGRDINVIVLGLKSKSHEIEREQKGKPKVLVTSFLYGTDFMSTAMSIHLTNYLLYGYVHKNKTITYLLENREIWIVPIINVDSYNFVSAYIAEWNRTCLITKNRRNNDPGNLCGDYGIGVNLNRNFDVNFDELESTIGPQALEITKSEHYVCKPYYKGPNAFSEPETQAIQKLLDKESFSVGINLMGFGPMFLIPYSYSNDSNNQELKEKEIYLTIQEECPFPNGTKFGTKYQILGETHHGEISDYMLQKKSIISGSFYLGLAEKGYEGNFPVPSKAQRILQENLESMLYFIQKAGVNLRIEEQAQGRCNNEIIDCRGYSTPSYYFRTKVSNTGLLDYAENITLFFSFMSEELYELQQVLMTTSSGGKFILFIQDNHENKTTYEIEIPPLFRGEYVIISPVFVRTSSAFLGHYSPIPSDEPQHINLYIKDYPKTKQSQLQGTIIFPNFDIDEYEERKNFNQNVILIIFSIIFILGCLAATVFMIAKCMKKGPKVKFSKLEESTDSSRSYAYDQEGDIEFDSVVKMEYKSKNKEKVKIEMENRTGRTKNKEKRDKSQKKSKDRIGSSSRERSGENKKEQSKEKKNKESRKTSSEKGVVKRKDKSKEKKEKTKERSPDKVSSKKKE